MRIVILLGLLLSSEIAFAQWIWGQDSRAENLTTEGANVKGTGTTCASPQITLKDDFDTGVLLDSGEFQICVGGASLLGVDASGPKSGSYRLDGATSGTLTQQAAAATTSYTVTWPAAAPGGTEFVQMDSSGNLSTVAGGVSDLQAAYVAGNTITTSAANGDVTIAGDQDLVVTSTGEVRIERSSANPTLQFKDTGGDVNFAVINFGDSTSNFAGSIQYDHAQDKMTFHAANGNIDFEVNDTQVLSWNDGTAGAPAYSFINDTDQDTGMRRSAEDTLAFGTDGSDRLIVGPTGLLSVTNTVSADHDAITITSSINANDEESCINWVTDEAAAPANKMAKICAERDSGNDRGIHFYTTTDRNNYSEAVHINHQGYVGIGIEPNNANLHVLNASGAAGRFQRDDSSGSSANLSFYKSISGGALTTGADMGGLYFNGHDGTDYREVGSMRWEAAQNFTGSARGTDIFIRANPNNSTTQVTRYKITGAGTYLFGDEGADTPGFFHGTTGDGTSCTTRCDSLPSGLQANSGVCIAAWSTASGSNIGCGTATSPKRCLCAGMD